LAPSSAASVRDSSRNKSVIHRTKAFF
jgi:hypothetical protein